jgi:DNA helicase-2/ATP-dependent DNA helicase PcrA
MDILADLNKDQKEAVEAIQGPLLIMAGPGSGKTRVITHRIAYLIKTCGINPHRIMAVTFTNKAAREMQERLGKLLGQSVDALTLGTFHAICARILRQDGKAIGLDPRFTIYDEEDQLNLIKQCLQDAGLDPKLYTPRAIQNKISYAKSHLMSPNAFSERIGSYFDEVVFRVYERYQQLLDKSHTVDFDDLLMKTVSLFSTHNDVLSKYQSRYLHLLVDEFQDTNLMQYQLIKQISGKHRNICVVGDPDQSIYSWRYADLRNILSFESDFPDAKVVFLEQNYRSTQAILNVASSIISANVQRKEKKLTTENEPGIPVSIVKTYSENDEAQFVASEIDRLVNEDSLTPADFAVMYRVNAQSRALEEAFIRYGMPYKLVGGTRFYQRREVKDVIAYLKFLHNPDDTISLLRIINVPTRGIGAKTLAELTAFAKENDISLFKALEMVAEKKGPSLGPRATIALTGFYTLTSELVRLLKELALSELFKEIVERTGYHDAILNEEDGKDRWENIMELRTVAREYDYLEPEEALSAFLEKVSLVSDIDELDEKVNATVLTTLHQAKGLEFPVVFIVGTEEGLLPHRRSIDDPDELEEERRLCYVGVTRAKKRVYLVHTYHRNLFGTSSGTEPSRFLDDIPAELVTTSLPWGGKQEENEYDETDFTPVTALYSKTRTQPPPRPKKTIELSAGDRVQHAMFGEGEVVSCKQVGDDLEVTVNFHDGGVKRLLLSFAPLEKIE